jgi:yeast amino acid transporter
VFHCQGALGLVVTYWDVNAPIWAVILATVILYGIINALVVSAYGEAEFWLSSGKVILILSLFCFTFITMVGGNPKNDAYGFRYWQEPGLFKADTIALGRWEGFLAAVWNASFTVVGPEYLSLIAAEAKRPRVYMKAAYKTVYWRFGLFFLGGAFCVGIVMASNDPLFLSIVAGDTTGSGTAAASPYVIAMKNLGVRIYPDVVNALIVTSIFSAGNTYVYCATRSLYGMALEGRAPKLFAKCTKRGIPIYALAVPMVFSLLAFLQVSPKTETALGIIIGLVSCDPNVSTYSQC